jgi:hypothetical protein
MVLPTKLRNHNELKKRRNKEAVPLSEVNLLIYANVTGKLKGNQQKVQIPPRKPQGEGRVQRFQVQGSRV